MYTGENLTFLTLLGNFVFLASTFKSAIYFTLFAKSCIHGKFYFALYFCFAFFICFWFLFSNCYSFVGFSINPHIKLYYFLISGPRI